MFFNLLGKHVCTVPSPDVTVLNFAYIPNTCVNYVPPGSRFVLFLEHVFRLALNSSCFSNTCAKYARPGSDLLYFSNTCGAAARVPNSSYYSNTCAKCSRSSSEFVVFLEHVCKVQPASKPDRSRLWTSGTLVWGAVRSIHSCN